MHPSRLVRTRDGNRLLHGERWLGRNPANDVRGVALFQTMLDNAALARTDMEIAAEYAAIADPELKERFFPLFEEEYDRTTEFITVAGDWKGC